MTQSISPIVIICGATGSGKSALALSLAGKRNGVIINADSQQMYRDLRILTARPSEAEEALAPHRLYGTMSADEACSAGKWLQFAKMEIDWAHAEGKLPIVTGGTGLYLKALMQGIAVIPEIDPVIRAQAASDYDVMGKESFSERLRAVDPEFFTRLAVYDRQRLLRAYEVWLGTGKSLSAWQKMGATPPYPAECFELQIVELPREELYRRCDARFIKMIEEGAVEEVKKLLADPALRVAAHLQKIIGVPELTAYLNREMPLEMAISKAQQATRNYAKRQLTWFRNQLTS